MAASGLGRDLRSLLRVDVARAWSTWPRSRRQTSWLPGFVRAISGAPGTVSERGLLKGFRARGKHSPVGRLWGRPEEPPAVCHLWHLLGCSVGRSSRGEAWRGRVPGGCGRPAPGRLLSRIRGRLWLHAPLGAGRPSGAPRTPGSSSSGRSPRTAAASAPGTCFVPAEPTGILR